MTKKTESGPEEPGHPDEEQERSVDSVARRSTLRRIVLASGILTTSHSLSSNWKKPVVDAVVLPANAQTSPVEIYGVTGA